MINTTHRPAIPSGIKRIVRQRCGFGCVICGLPIYEYDHLPGYANVKRHREAELTLLCPTHHAAKTRGLLSDQQVVEANAAPFNKRSSSTSPFTLAFAGETPIIKMAEQTFTCEDKRRPTWMIPVMIDRHAPIGFTVDTNGLMLNLEAYDARGRQILRIRDSEIELSTSVFDAILVGPRLTIRDEPGFVDLDLVFVPPNQIEIRRCRIAARGALVQITPKEIYINRAGAMPLTIAGDGSIVANVGVSIGDVPRGMSRGITIGMLQGASPNSGTGQP